MTVSDNYFVSVCYGDKNGVSDQEKRSTTEKVISKAAVLSPAEVDMVCSYDGDTHGLFDTFILNGNSKKEFCILIRNLPVILHMWGNRGLERLKIPCAMYLDIRSLLSRLR